VDASRGVSRAAVDASQDAFHAAHASIAAPLIGDISR